MENFKDKQQNFKIDVDAVKMALVKVATKVANTMLLNAVTS